MPPIQTTQQKDLSEFTEAFTSGFSEGFSQGFSQGYAKATSQQSEDEFRPGTFNLWEKSGDGALHGSFARPAPDSHKYGKGPYTGRGPKLYQRSDEKISDDIHEELTQHPDIDASEVEINVKDGIVTLSGSIATRHMKEASEECVMSVSGVKKLINNLRIDTTTSTKSKTSETGAQAVLSRTVREP